MMYEQIAANKRKTWLVVGFYLILFLLVGIGLGYTVMDNAVAGMVIALVAGGLYTMMMISQSTDVVMRLNHATEVTEYEQAPQLWHIVEDMAMIAKVPRPRIFVIDDDSPNAFATGSSPEKAAVAVTTGLLQRLNREELEGVLAHEFAHIRNYDVRLQTIAIALGAVIAILVQFGSRMMFWGRTSRRSKDDENGIAAIMIVLIGFFQFSAMHLQGEIDRAEQTLKSPEMAQELKAVSETEDKIVTVKNDELLFTSLEGDFRRLHRVNKAFMDFLNKNVTRNLVFDDIKINNDNVEINGSSQEHLSIAKFEEELRKSEKFNHIFVDNITREEKDNNTVYKFNIKILTKDVDFNEEQK